MTPLYSRNLYSYIDAQHQLLASKVLRQTTGWVQLPADASFKSRTRSSPQAIWATDCVFVQAPAVRYRLRLSIFLPVWALTCKKRDVLKLNCSKDERIQHTTECIFLESYKEFHGASQLLLASIREGKEYGYDLPIWSFMDAHEKNAIVPQVPV